MLCAKDLSYLVFKTLIIVVWLGECCNKTLWFSKFLYMKLGGLSPLIKKKSNGFLSFSAPTKAHARASLR